MTIRPDISADHPRRTARITWHSTRIVLLLMVLMAPSLSLGQNAEPQPANMPRNMNPPERPPEVVVDISKKIESILPVGWSLKREKNIITIRRDKPIEWYGTISLPSHDLAYLKAHGFIQSGSYAITLEFFPPMSKAAVDRLVEDNRRIEERYYREHPQPKNIKPSVPWELRQSLHHIPYIVTKQYAVLVTPFIHGYGVAFFDEQDKKECEGVERDVRRLLKEDAEATSIVPDGKAALQGVWIAKSMETDGKPAPATTVKRMRFRFKGDKLFVRGNFENDTEDECEYKIDATKSPKHIDILPPKEKNPILGVYDIKGDELSLCLRHADTPGGRPTKFSTATEPNLILIVFKRTEAQ